MGWVRMCQRDRWMATAMALVRMIGVGRDEENGSERNLGHKMGKKKDLIACWQEGGLRSRGKS